eukprot:785511_1
MALVLQTSTTIHTYIILVAYILIFSNVINANIITNITFDTSLIELPVPLFGHISAVHDDTLHIIGGYTVNSSNLTTPSQLTYSFALNNSFEAHDIYPDFWTHPIACDQPHHQCSVAINGSLYIIQVYMRNYYVIVYDMNDYSYRLASEYVLPNLLYEDDIIGCVVSDGEWLWWVPADSVAYPKVGYQASYNIKHNDWTDIIWDSLSTPRHGMGCSYYHRHIYMFGGVDWGRNRHYDGQYIEKCKMRSEQDIALINPECTLVLGSLMHPGSFFHVETFVSSYGTYILIFGGTVEDIQTRHSLEIFNLHTEQMLTTTEYMMNGLNAYQFSSVILRDDLLITGGQSSKYDGSPQKAVKQTNIPQILLSDSDRPTFNYDCITTYDGLYYRLKEYLYRNEDQQLVFEVYSTDYNETAGAMSYTFWVYLEFFGDTIEWWMHKDFERSVFAWGMGWDDVPDGTVDIRTISEFTNIDMTQHRSAFWMKWSALHDETGKAISTPTFRIGFGDIVDRYPLSDFVSNTDLYGAPVSGMYKAAFSSQSDKMHWKFYHNECSTKLTSHINANDTYTFKIGDPLYIGWDLTQASSLNVPIYITSDDIMDMNYTLYIQENDLCLLCKLTEGNVCTMCSNPVNITIRDLYFYNTDKNYYEVSVSSHSDLQLQIKDENPVKLTRMVMDVNIQIEMEKQGLYPHSELLLIPVYDRNNVTQPNASIAVIWDDDLSFNTQCHMFIDFYADTCLIIYDNHTIDCTDPIIIPGSMKFKTVDSNAYDIVIESNNVHLFGGQYGQFSFPRRVQTVSIDFNGTLSLGDVFLFDVNGLDSQIYQQTSSLIISNHLYGIAAIIHIEYDTDQCFIVTPITGSKDVCDKGVEMKISNRSVVGHYAHLKIESEDTYINEYNNTVSIIPIFIDDCPLGQGLIGTATSSYSCTDCQLDHVDIFRDSHCTPCYDISGIQCNGKSDLIIAYNYWIAVNHTRYLLPIFQADSPSIISNFCPSGYCCQDIQNGCNYMQNLEKLCAPYRNPNTPLCGSCMDGYSEVFGSTSCRQCTNNLWVLLILFVVAFLIVLLLMLADRPPRITSTQKPTTTPSLNSQASSMDYFKLIAKDDLKSLLACYLRPMLYFFQGISFISLQTGFWFYLTPLMNMLSLDLFAMQRNKESGVCFLDGLNSINKELWYLYFPGCMFISIGIIGLIAKATKVQFRQISWQDCWSIFIIFIGNVMTTILKLLACTEIGSVYVHFYAGYQECFDVVWFFALILFAVLIVLWMAVWFKLYRMDTTQRESRFSAFRTITKHYKPKFWYWETV